MKLCIELNNVSFGIKVEQAANGSFRVTYGKQVKQGLTYTQAAEEFGYCVFHALACDSKLDNNVK